MAAKVQWFVNIDPSKPGDPHWLAYPDADSAKLEKNKARATVLLNDTYKIDFRSMRQVRRDDDSRWRAIKRGGSVTDKPPKGVADDDEDEASAAAEEEEEPAPKKPAAKAAPKKAAVKKTAKQADEDDEAEEEAPPAKAAKGKAKAAAASDDVETDPAWTVPATPSPFTKDAAAAAAKPAAPAAAAAAPAPPAAAAASVAVPGPSAELKLRAELDSLRQQLADVESEQEAALAANKKALADAAQAHKTALDKALAEAAASHKAALAEAKAVSEHAAKVHHSDLAVAKNATTAAKNEAACAKAEADSLAKELAAAKAASAKAAQSAREASEARAEAARLRSLYATLIAAIKPVAEAFGLSKASPIGKIVAEWDQAGGGSALGAAAAASTAEVGKKRGRDAEQDEPEVSEDEAPPVAKKARAPAAAAAAAPARPAAAAVVPAPSEDDDATQPMVAQDEDMPEERAAAAASASVRKQPAPYAGTPVSMSPQLVSRPSDPAVLSVAAVRAQGGEGERVIALTGCINGGLNLWSFTTTPGSSISASRLELELRDRAKHPFATLALAGDEGDWSKTAYVAALIALPLLSDATGNSFLVLAGEGRLLRSYLLTLDSAGSQGTLKLQPGALDLGDGSWVTCLTRLTDPAAGRDSQTAYVGVGVSGAAHSVRVVRVAVGGAAAAAKPVQVRSLPTRSEEVRGVAQLPSSGRLVAAGCSVALPGLKDEGGAIELWSFAGAADGAQGELLQSDIRVSPAVGLRCNAIRVLPAGAAGSGETLLAALEFCSNGARQLQSFRFDAAGQRDVAATPVENKHTPPLDENTFTGLAVAPAHPDRALAMTYGGKLLVFDVAPGSASASRAGKALSSQQAHGEAPQEDCTHVFVLDPPGASRPVLLTAGGKSELKMWK